MAATISPFSAVGCCRITTQSSSEIAASIIESPTTFNRKRVPSPTSGRGSGKTSSTISSARIGPPAAMRPTTGTNTGLAPDMDSPAATSPALRTSTARGRLASRRRYPLRSRTVSWWATLDVDASPVASQISRMLGGYPRRSTDSRMISRIARCRVVRPSGPGGAWSSLTEAFDRLRAFAFVTADGADLRARVVRGAASVASLVGRVTGLPATGVSPSHRAFPSRFDEAHGNRPGDRTQTFVRTTRRTVWILSEGPVRHTNSRSIEQSFDVMRL